LAWSADSRHLLGLRDLAQDHADELKAHMDAARKDFMKPPPVLDRKPRPQIALYDPISGEVFRRLGNEVRPDVLAESPPDGKWVAAATIGGLLQLWPAAGGELITLEKQAEAALTIGPPSISVVLAWSPEGKRLAFSTLAKMTIRLWDPANPHQPPQTLGGHGAPLRSLAWSQDSTRLASAGDDGTVKIWNVSGGKQASTFPYYCIKPAPITGVGKPRYPSTLSWSPDGKKLAVAGEDETIRIVRVDTKEELRTLHGHPSRYDSHDAVCAVAWSPDGKRLAAASPDGTFLLWDTATWEEVLVLGERPHVGMLNRQGALAWSSDGRQLASFGYILHTSSVLIWDAMPEEDQLSRQQVPRR
jgi:WD40 repeat protein